MSTKTHKIRKGWLKMMSKKDVKENAQDIIMSNIANSLYSLANDIEFSDSDKLKIVEEVKKQSNRVAKMFGYDEAWFN